MKRICVIMMALGLCAMLWSCSGKEQWQSLTYHVTSSVMAEGCHFTLQRQGDEMLLSGYCFDGGTEHRREQSKPISRETAEAIEALLPEKTVAAAGKPSNMVDGKQVTVTLGYPDGSEKKVSLSPEQQSRLFDLLQKELAGK